MSGLSNCKACNLTNLVDLLYRCTACHAPRPEMVPWDEQDQVVLIWEELYCEAVVKRAGLLDDGEPTQIEFEVYRVEGFTDDQAEPVAHYVVLNAGGNDKTTTDRARAGILMRGNIKWDGCSNVEYRPQHQYNHEHYCHKESAMLPGTIIGYLYDFLAVLRFEIG